MTMEFPRLLLLPWFSRACSGLFLPRYLGGLDRSRDPEEPHHWRPCPPQLVAHRRYALSDRGWNRHLVFYSPHARYFPHNLVRADPQHPDCDSGHGRLMQFPGCHLLMIFLSVQVLRLLQWTRSRRDRRNILRRSHFRRADQLFLRGPHNAQGQ